MSLDQETKIEEHFSNLGNLNSSNHEIKIEKHFENKAEEIAKYQKMTNNPIYELQEDKE